MNGKLLKGALVVLGAVVLSTLGIFASDGIRGIDTGANIAGVGGAATCKEGSAPFKVDGNTICVDRFEESPSKGCPFQTLGSAIDTERNMASKECFAASVAGGKPWTFVSLSQAERLCAALGKRLPSAKEWYDIALGTDPGGCVIHESAAKETGTASCVSSANAYDAVGNVWEWVDETVKDGTWGGRALPGEGYVTSVDENGIVITTGESADPLYGKDYAWTKGEGVLGMIRGGFYGSADDAGLYTLNAAIPTSFATQGVGFRCVEDVL
ncbi:MAG TPA: SUMF1/EgtB/PvdO family nonheme iron enzyme [Candidatus Paceibacterota bacterium]|nr:SUMF1/EgtB/PvdO family nonheme iron enzyme [Candidatus Paceibacterota bacterium]